MKVDKVIGALDKAIKSAKKAEKPVNDVVFNFMSTLVGKLNMNYFRAIETGLKLNESTKEEIANAELTCKYAWDQVSRGLDEFKLHLFKLCKNGKWILARAILAEFETALTKFLFRQFSYDNVKWFVDDSIKTKGYLETKYLPQFGVLYNKVKREVKIHPELVTDKAVKIFYENIRNMGELGLALVEQLREDIYNKKYREAWDKYSVPTLTIDDAFKDSESREVGLCKLIELFVFDWSDDGTKPELTFMQNWKEEGKKGKKGSGLKRLLGAWLDACDRKGLLNQNLSDTERALAVLNFFGLDANDENDVREMIGKKMKDSNYVEKFENW